MAEASNRNNTTEAAQSEPLMRLHLKSQVGGDGYYRVSPNKKIVHVLLQHCKQNGLEYPTVKFIHDGVRVNVAKTPAELGLCDGDQIDVETEQTGGGDVFN